MLPVISLILPYHNNPCMMARQYENLAALPRYIRNQIDLVYCDDCSSEPPPFKPAGLLMDVQGFRINGAHVPWSHRVATNIAAHESRGAFLLLTDVDHIVPEDTWRALLVDPYLLHPDGMAFTFSRRNVDGSEYKPHPDSWFMRRAHWERIGGYDERYRGHYGQNAAFIDRVKYHGKIVARPPPLIRYGREDIPDASERVLERKLPADRAAVAAMRAEFHATHTYFERHALTASYHRVTP